MQILTKMNRSEMKFLQHIYQDSDSYNENNKTDRGFVESVWKEVYFQLPVDKTFIVLTGKKFDNPRFEHYFFIYPSDKNGSNLYDYLMNLFSNRRLITVSEFDKLQYDFLHSDAFVEECSNQSDIDFAFLNYYPYEDVHIEVKKDLDRINISDYWSDGVTIPYDCELFWWLYNKFFKGES